MPSCSPTIERCKALLGTFVRIRIAGVQQPQANEILDRCFEEMAEIHRLMSFQERGSDISRLNRGAHEQPLQVDARTYEVLRHAALVSERSDGVFDVTVAAGLVRAGLAERPHLAVPPDPRAVWSDVQLLADRHVLFSRPLWIDVSGIAKGYAVDRAMSLLEQIDPLQACVNAGGDLRVRGPEAEPVRLDVELTGDEPVPVVELRNGSMASSGARPGASAGADVSEQHIDGSTARSSPLRFVSVLAPSCTIADALTKVVMAAGERSVPVLRAFSARAIMSDGPGWREVA